MSKVDGKMKLGEFTVVLDINALCDLEEAFGLDDVNGVIAKIGSLQEKPSLRTIRTMFAAAARQEHPDVTDVEIGHAIHELGLESAAELLGDLCAAAFPEADGKEVPSGGKKRKGAGTRS